MRLIATICNSNNAMNRYNISRQRYRYNDSYSRYRYFGACRFFYCCFDVAFEVLLIMCLTFELMMCVCVPPQPRSECGQLIIMKCCLNDLRINFDVEIDSLYLYCPLPLYSPACHPYQSYSPVSVYPLEIAVQSLFEITQRLKWNFNWNFYVLFYFFLCIKIKILFDNNIEIL